MYDIHNACTKNTPQTHLQSIHPSYRVLATQENHGASHRNVPLALLAPAYRTPQHTRPGRGSRYNTSLSACPLHTILPKCRKDEPMPGVRCCRAITRPHIPLHNSRHISARQMALWFCGGGRRHGRARKLIKMWLWLWLWLLDWRYVGIAKSGEGGELNSAWCDA
jgi:hypothetical protein